MPSPVSAITDFWNRLRATKALNGVPPLLSAKKYAEGRSAPSICMFPTTGTIAVYGNKKDSKFYDDLKFVAHCWGKDFDDAAWLRERFIEALTEQAVGAADGSNAGYLFTLDSEAWDTSFDTSRTGEAVEVRFTLSQTPLGLITTGIGTVNEATATSTTGMPPEIDIT